MTLKRYLPVVLCDCHDEVPVMLAVEGGEWVSGEEHDTKVNELAKENAALYENNHELAESALAVDELLLHYRAVCSDQVLRLRELQRVPRCQESTKAGNPCKNPAMADSALCGQHYHKLLREHG